MVVLKKFEDFASLLSPLSQIASPSEFVIKRMGSNEKDEKMKRKPKMNVGGELFHLNDKLIEVLFQLLF